MDTKKEIFGWFPAESQAYLDRIIKENNVKTVIEVGCFLGKSTAFFAERVDKVYVVDTFVQNGELQDNGDAREYPTNFYKTFERNMQDRGHWPKISVLKMTSVEASEVCPNADLIYIDASHDFGNVFRDLLKWYKKADIVCGDDYDENWPGVKEAVDSFQAYVKPQVEGRVWCFIKRPKAV